MGNIFSYPQVDGLATVSPLSSTTSSSLYGFNLTRASALGFSTKTFNDFSTESNLVVPVPFTQIEEAPPADVTDVMMIDGTPSPQFMTTIATYPSTATVTSRIKSTNLITATVTVIASSCPTTTVSNTIQAVPSTRVFTTSTAKTLRRSSRLAKTSHHGISGQPENRVHTAQTTDLTRQGSNSHSERLKSVFRGPDDADCESDYKPLPCGAPLETTNLARVPGIQKTSNNPCQNSITTLTKFEHVTTTTVYKTTITNHTTTKTITTSPISCHTNRTSTSSPTCISVTPNPNPPANNICAEDSLLEYSNTPQSPNTLEGCAAACLADSSCLSFTFIPSESTCYTSLYPLADSAFAGVQEYRIDNYDRDCYSCSS